MKDLTSMTPVAATRQAVLTAVQDGITAAAQHEQQLAETAQSAAEEIIAKIPQLIQTATTAGLRQKLRNQTFRAELMPIGIDDTSEYLHTHATDILSGTFVNPKTLVHAARAVFDHCEASGLHVFVARDKLDENQYVTYSLNISWTLPGKEQLPKPRRLWLAWIR